MMENGQPTSTVNEFGSVTNKSVVDDGSLNQMGKEPTLADILAEIRGKDVDRVKPATRQVDTTPGQQAKVGEEDAKAADADPLAGSGDPVNTGNKALDVAVNSFMKSTGASDADVQRACKNAIDYNDPSLIDDAFLKERFKDRADEARTIIEAVLEQSQIERQRTIDAVYSTAGGEEAWKQSLSVYKEHAPAGLQKALKMMFDSGDAASVKEAAEMVVDFAKGSGVITKSGTRMTAGSGTHDVNGLSKAEFQTALSKLNQSSRTYHGDYARLIELRRVGTALGK
ncbi:putative scaffolding protein [Pseudomonas phage Ep4]|uniref:Scaffolding protein n=1 Tax=Pseudomonas phage Ep4 TaxID=3057492 RepID=A0AAU9EED6_9CAUD|nr:putative scaffolding protein [Pseudomonas phage Ep4]